MNEIEFDKDWLFDFMLAGTTVDAEPKTYEEAINGFHNTKESEHHAGHRVRYLHGKVTYLWRMIELNREQSKHDIIEVVLPNIRAYDPLTQYYVIQQVRDLHLSEAWDSLVEIYLLSRSWRLQSAALWGLIQFAEEKGETDLLRAIIDGALKKSPYLKSNKMAGFSIEHYLQFSTAQNLSDILALCRRESAFLSKRALMAYKKIIYEVPSDSILSHLDKAETPDLLVPMLESLYVQSGTAELLPTFITNLLRSEKLLSKYSPSKETSLKDLFVYLMINEMSPQERGLRLERMLMALFNESHFKTVVPFMLQGEQVDGLVEFEQHHYLIEAKWTKKKTSASTVYSFRGKVEARLIGTRGLFISINGFSPNCVATLSTGKALNIILVDGNDIYEGLSSPGRFISMLSRKIQEASRSGNIYSVGNLRIQLLNDASMPDRLRTHQPDQGI